MEKVEEHICFLNRLADHIKDGDAVLFYVKRPGNKYKKSHMKCYFTIEDFEGFTGYFDTYALHEGLPYDYWRLPEIENGELITKKGRVRSNTVFSN